MRSIEKIVNVEVPLDVTFATWANYNSFPAFTKNRVTVEKLGRTRTRWIVDLLGYSAEFEAEVDDIKPNKLLSWHSTTGVRHFGSVYFVPGDGSTTVTVRLTFDTEHIETRLGIDIAAKWCELEALFDDILEGFKAYVEQMWWQVPEAV